jgi:hypothetical protein
MRDNLHDRIEKLKNHRDEARVKLMEAEETADDTWDQVKDSIETAWNKVTTSVRDLFDGDDSASRKG